MSDPGTCYEMYAFLFTAMTSLHHGASLIVLKHTEREFEVLLTTIYLKHCRYFEVTQNNKNRKQALLISLESIGRLNLCGSVLCGKTN